MLAGMAASLVLAAYPLDGGAAVRGPSAAVPSLASPGVVVLDLSDKDNPSVAARVPAPDLGGLEALPVGGLVFALEPAPAQLFARTSAGFWTIELGDHAPAKVMPFVPVGGLERLRWDGEGDAGRLIAVTTAGGLAFDLHAGEKPTPATPMTAEKLLGARAVPTATPKKARAEPGLGRCPEKFEKTAKKIIGERRKGKIENLRCDEFVAATGEGPLARWRVFTYTRRAPGEREARPERVIYDIVKSREKRGFLVIDPAP